MPYLQQIGHSLTGLTVAAAEGGVEGYLLVLNDPMLQQRNLIVELGVGADVHVGIRVTDSHQGRGSGRRGWVAVGNRWIAGSRRREAGPCAEIEWGSLKIRRRRDVVLRPCRGGGWERKRHQYRRRRENRVRHAMAYYGLAAMAVASARGRAVISSHSGLHSIPFRRNL